MFDLMKWLLPIGLMSFAGEGEGGGKGDEGKGGEEDSGKEDTVSKADHDKVIAEHEKTKTDLEDIRMEVLSPEYLEFLNTKDGKGKDKGDEKPAESDTTLTDEKIEGMSKKEILAEGERRATLKFDEKLNQVKEGYSSDKKAATQREVQEFARLHDDFHTYRPVMYGLSIDPKNASKGLAELYTMAKDHVKGIHAETTEEEKTRQEKIKGEKPGGAQDSYERLKKLTPEEAGKEAFKETRDKLGPLPTA